MFIHTLSPDTGFVINVYTGCRIIAPVCCFLLDPKPQNLFVPLFNPEHFEKKMDGGDFFMMVVLVSIKGVHVLDVKLSGLGHIPSPEQQYATGHSA